MKTYDMWCTVAVPIVIAVENVNETSATLQVEKMFERGELTDRVIVSLREGNATIDVDNIEELYN